MVCFSINQHCLFKFEWCRFDLAIIIIVIIVSLFLG